MVNSYPDIDIILITFNHESFIMPAVESILFQEYPGRVRVIVADDASTDATVSIIEETVKNQNRVQFSVLPPTRNLGITKNYERAFSAATADYVAVLEGDDYWASSKKLLKQVEFLQEHRECAACGCNYYIKDAAQFSHKLRIDATNGFMVVTPQILIGDNLIGNFSTCMYRKAALQSLPKKLFSVKSYDWITNICVAMHGPIGILFEPLSVYRVHAEGTWNTMDAHKKLSSQLETLPIYNEVTEGHFEDEFEKLGERLLAQIACVSGSRSPLSYVKIAVAGLLPSSILRPLQSLYRKVAPRPSVVRSTKLQSC